VALIVLIRWCHAIAATAWVGGTLFYLLVLNPSLQPLAGTPERATLSAAVARHFRDLTQACVAVVLLTGGVLTFDRLSQPHLERAYVIVLAVKIALALLMVALASGLGPRRRRARARPRWLTAPYLIMVLGLLVYLLAILLQVLFDVSYGAAS
jgi:putative copper export protein